MEIRIASNEDDSKSASYIYAMGWKSGYRGMLSDALLDGIALDFWAAMFNENYKSRRFEIAILSDNGEDIGACAYGLSRDYDDPSIGEVTSIYFLDKAWGKGYAGKLMEFMLGRLRAEGCKKVSVWTFKDNLRAQRFYEKCGFSRTGGEKAITFKGEEKINVEYMLEP